MPTGAVPAQSAMFQGEAFRALSLPWIGFFNDLLKASGADSSAGTSGVATVLNLGVIMSDTVIVPPDSPSDGAGLFVVGTMDGIGHVVSWDASFQWPPKIDTTPSLSFAALFIGVGAKWVLAGMPIVGRHA
jgi:hypothetical protein